MEAEDVAIDVGELASKVGRLLALCFFLGGVAGPAGALSMSLSPAVDGRLSRTVIDDTVIDNPPITNFIVLPLGHPVGPTSYWPALEFDLSPLASATILSATLELVTASPQSQPFPLTQLRQFLRGYAGDGVLSASDINAGSILQAFTPPAMSGALNALDVTAFVQSLPVGGFAGFFIGGGPMSGGEFYTYHASEAADPDVRPRLVVELAVPEPASVGLLALSLVATLRARRRPRLRPAWRPRASG